MFTLGLANAIIAVLATLAPIAHVLEMPNKLALDGPLWLAIQQHLYRGWGPFIGAPTEIGALVTSLLLVVFRDRNSRTRRLAFVAVVAYAAMLATFFVFNQPVNAALNRWTAATLPPDWSSYRLRWEIGHAVAAALSIIGAAAAVGGYMEENRGRPKSGMP